MVRQSQKPYQLLIADDDCGFRQTIKFIFEAHFETLEVESGEEAIAVVERQPIDIALLDMHMAELTGLETIRILKSLNAVAPCILITADATEQLCRDASRADAYKVLRKPISKDELVVTVSTAIEDAYDDPELQTLLF